MLWDGTKEENVLSAVIFPVLPEGALTALGIQPREQSGRGHHLENSQLLADSELISELWISRL